MTARAMQRPPSATAPRTSTTRPSRPVVAPRRVEASAGSRWRAALVRAAVLALWFGIAGTLLVWGFEYYATPLRERAYSAFYDELNPSGIVGQGYGVIGTLLMAVGVTMYSLRRRVRFFHRFGKIKHWLSVHIFLCTMGPFLIVLHTTFKFGGIVSIAFWSMVAVVASGFFGRYVYVRIPKTLNGQFMSLQSIEEHRTALLRTIALRSGLSEADVQGVHAVARRRPPTSFAGALLQSVWNDLRAGFHDRQVQRVLAAKGVPPKTRAAAASLFREEAKLEQQVALLQPFQRLFKYWHLFHMPLAIVMLVVVLVHVTVAVLLGYTWLF